MPSNKAKEKFLHNHLEMFVERLCYTYPLSSDLLRKHGDLLRWDLISFNERMNWSLDMMLEFKDKLDFGLGDQEQETKWINLNRAIPWNCELLEAFEDKLQWRELSVNQRICSNADIRSKFYHKLLPYLEDDHGEDYQEDEDYHDDMDDIEEMEWLITSIEEMSNYAELEYHRIEEIDFEAAIDWDQLSQNIYLPWTQEFIAKYSDKWNWYQLSVNESLPWSESLIAAFEDNWVWGGLGDCNEQGERPLVWGLTANDSIHWTPAMLERFEHNHDWFHLSYMENVEWSIEIVLEYGAKFQYEQFLFNNSLWTGVFGSLLTDSQIDRIFRIFKLQKSLCLN